MASTSSPWGYTWANSEIWLPVNRMWHRWHCAYSEPKLYKASHNSVHSHSRNPATARMSLEDGYHACTRLPCWGHLRLIHSLRSPEWGQPTREESLASVNHRELWGIINAFPTVLNMKFGLVCYATTADTAGTPALKLSPTTLASSWKGNNVHSFLWSNLDLSVILSSR